MTIKVGDKIPEATLMQMTDKGPAPVKTSDLFKGKKDMVSGPSTVIQAVASARNAATAMGAYLGTAQTTAKDKRSRLPICR